jgi:Holliday junction resolvase YEN1
VLGGTNPALRTLYYRLIRLLSLSIQPLFVFDGPHKPPFKRNKRTGPSVGASITDITTKKLLDLFGFPYHVAPGEAEAECALLQRAGVVDAVLSEDVDTLMFGCGQTLRNWSNEDSSSHAPTHVSLYDSKSTVEGRSGLDREGMILVALMSGGDYITEGIPQCGIKVACEAARAGYGKSLCRIKRQDTAGFKNWRDELAHELRTNESKQFRTKHKALQIPPDFPNVEILGYYTHPVVSADIPRLKERIRWDREVDVTGLRQFVADTFQWTGISGAKKFIRGLAPALLVSRLVAKLRGETNECDDPVQVELHEKKLVKAISARRQHSTTDDIPELRLVFHPAELVGLDLEAETTDDFDIDRDGLAPAMEDGEINSYQSDRDGEETSRQRSGSPQKRPTRLYDPFEPDKVWVAETIAKVGIPLLVQDYEETLRNPMKKARARAAAKGVTKKSGQGRTLDNYFAVTKPSVTAARLSAAAVSSTSLFTKGTNTIAKGSADTRNHNSNTAIYGIESTRSSQASIQSHSHRRESSEPTRKGTGSRSHTDKRVPKGENPWTIALSSSPTSSKTYRPGVHISKPVTRNPQHSHELSSPRQPVKKRPVVKVNDTQLLQSPKPSGTTCSVQRNLASPPSPDPELPPLHVLFPTPTKRPARPPKQEDTREEDIRTQGEVIDLLSSPTVSRAEEEGSLKSRRGAELSSTEGHQTANQGYVGRITRGRKFLMLRESLEGSWKEESEDTAPLPQTRERGRVWRKSAIEILDLTGDG